MPLYQTSLNSLNVRNEFGRQCPNCFDYELNSIFDELFFFVVWLTDERRLALFPLGTIVRYPYRRESPTRREQDLNLRRT